MEELVKDVFTAPVGTIFVLAGVLFLFIAVIGKISGKIEPGLKARVLAGVLGSAFIIIGLAMNWSSLPHPAFPTPSTTGEKKPTKEDTPSQTTSLTPTDSTPDEIPHWVPLHPVGRVEDLSIKIREGGGQYGHFSFISTKAVDLLEFYQTNLEMKGWKVKTNGDTLSATNEGGSQSIVVTSRPSYDVARLYLITFSESTK